MSEETGESGASLGLGSGASSDAAPTRERSKGTNVTTSDDDFADEEIVKMTSGDLALRAAEFEEKQKQESLKPSSGRSLLVNSAVGDPHSSGDDGHANHKKKGAFAGVFVPTCENMWGVLIFLRFYFIVGHAGVGQALGAVLLSFGCAFCTVSSMSAIASSGGHVSQGGPYYMISRALGPVVGVSVGVMYWLAITMLAVLETLGAVEGLLMVAPDAEFSGCAQAYGSVFLISLVLMVYLGMSFVTKLGIFFVFVVFFTLFTYYAGLILAPYTDAAKANPMVTGLSFDTFRDNWSAHYGDDPNVGQVSFGVVLSVFFPCFTGILSGANRADVLKDPPKNIREGTFGAIIFSLFMYSSFMILWGSVADYKYLQGIIIDETTTSAPRRLAGAASGSHLVKEIAFNPGYENIASIGIIISSLSQALQCLIVSPRLLQSIAKDKILGPLNIVAPLTNGEPKRALVITYVVAGCLVLIGSLDMVAPLLSMCFLVAYAFMNVSCLTLTMLKSPAWRPKGIHKRRWRFWYMGTGGCGFCIALSIMFTINPFWACGAFFMAFCIYGYVNWTLEAREWGSAMDGIKYTLALNSLIQLEASMQHHVNWRPQVLILYRVHLADELKGVKHHEILKFYSHLRKANGFCVVACVLESQNKDEHVYHKARLEKNIIKSIMKEEGIQGFAEVVVSPSWAEGTNYIIQLTGIGGLVPNTVLLDWPSNWLKYPKKANDFVQIVSTALAEDKAVLACKGLTEMPMQPVVGTIDIWWMIHDGGFMILLCYLLQQHRTWRQCHLRVFTITEGISEDKAQKAAQALTRTLRKRRLLDVDVEVILADDEMIEPYTYDWTLRVEERHNFLEKLGPNQAFTKSESIPLEIDDLLNMENDKGDDIVRDTKDYETAQEDLKHISISDVRKHGQKPLQEETAFSGKNDEAASSLNADQEGPQRQVSTSSFDRRASILGAMVSTPGSGNGDKQDGTPDSKAGGQHGGPTHLDDHVESFQKLNSIIYNRSKRSQLVVMNLPDLWGTSPDDVKKFMSYCETLTNGLDRVLFVHSSGHEIFDIQT